MAEAKAVELVAGARVQIQSSVYESKPGEAVQRKFKPEAAWRTKYPNIRIKTRAEDGVRYAVRTLVYPYPAGLEEDPFTKAPAKDMTPQELAVAIAEWSKVIDAIKAAGGRVKTAVPDGEGVKVVEFTLDLALLDKVCKVKAIFNKGYSLSIQGPMNSEMVKDMVDETKGGKKVTPTKAAAAASDIG